MLWVQVCNMCIGHSFTILHPDLWIYESFHHLFYDAPKPWGKGVIPVSHMWLHSHFSALTPFMSSSINHCPRNKNTPLIMSETLTNLLVEKYKSDSSLIVGSLHLANDYSSKHSLEAVCSVIMGSWPEWEYKECISFCGVGLNSHQKEVANHYDIHITIA